MYDMGWWGTIVVAQLLYTLHGHHGAATASAFTAGGDFFASGGADRVVMVWRANLDLLEVVIVRDRSIRTMMAE